MLLRICLSIFYVALLAASVVADGAFEFDNGVLVLNEKNFESAIAQYDTLLVEFYAPWCGHCQRMEPEYARAAQQLLQQRSPVKLAKVDATVERKLGRKFARGFPTLKLFKDGIPTDCYDVRTAEEILNWLTKKLGPPTEKLTSPAEARRLAGSQSVTAIGFFRHASSSAAAQFDRAVFYDAGSMPCGHTASPEVFAEFGIDKDTVVVFNNMDSKVVHFTGPFTFERLREFVRENKRTAVVEINSENLDFAIGGGRDSAILFVRRHDESEFKETLNQVRPVALKFKDQIRFSFSDVDKDTSLRLHEIFHVGDDELPALLAIRGRAKFRLQFADLTVDSVEAFVQDVLSGKARPYLRSQRLPSDWDRRPVKQLVGKNFNDVARNMSQNVLVSLCVPSSPKCQEVTKVLQALAETFKDSEDVVMAELNIRENDLEGVEFGRIPSLKFFPARTHRIVDFEGEPTLEELQSFVEDNRRRRRVRRQREEL